MAFFVAICAIASWVGVQLALAGIVDVGRTTEALGMLYVLCIIIAVGNWLMEFEG